MSQYYDPKTRKCPLCGNSGKIFSYPKGKHQPTCAGINDFNRCQLTADVMPQFDTEDEAYKFWNSLDEATAKEIAHKELLQNPLTVVLSS